MSKKTILKHFHRPIGLPAFLSPMGRLNLKSQECRYFRRKITFTPSCAYNLGDDDQYDWNKLYGLCFGITGIHKNSVRFGWRYNTATDLIEISTIVYSEGTVSRMRLAEVQVNHEYEYEIKLCRWEYDPSNLSVMFYIRDNGSLTGVRHFIIHPTAKCYFGCGFYFGGNKRAPHRMTIKTEKQ